MSEVFKVRHKPSGLFYQPVKGKYKRTKTNLGVRGKVYTTKAFPKFSKNYQVDVSENLVKKYNLDAKESSWSLFINTSPEDWEIVEYNLIEVKR